MNKAPIALCAVIFFSTLLYSQNENFVSKSMIDWEKATLVFEVTAPLDLEGAPFPRARIEAERRIADELAGIFFRALDNVNLNSTFTVGGFLLEPSLVNDRHLYLEALNGIVPSGNKIQSLVSPDYRTLTVVYEYSLFGENGLFTPLIRHSRPLPLPRVFGYHITRSFTGVVIYAKGPFSSFGKKTERLLAPALAPRIFYLSKSGTIEPVLEMNMVKPEALRTRGMVGYSYSTDRAAYALRAGSFPLEITAFAVYGINNTDIVISQAAANMLLSKEENRELLRDGKIVVIIDQPAPK